MAATIKPALEPAPLSCLPCDTSLCLKPAVFAPAKLLVSKQPKVSKRIVNGPAAFVKIVRLSGHAAIGLESDLLLAIPPPQLLHFAAPAKQLIESSLVKNGPLFEHDDMVGSTQRRPAM